MMFQSFLIEGLVVCVIFSIVLKHASCREYVFPMCPPRHWEVPGGKILTSGEVTYKLVCNHGYTQPMLENRSETFVCKDGLYEPLPKRCVSKIFAHETLEFGMSIDAPDKGEDDEGGGNLCNDLKALRQLEGVRFQSSLSPEVYRWLEDMRVKVHQCHVHDNATTFVHIRLQNVMKGNGTDSMVTRYYSLIISQTYFTLSVLLNRNGYKLHTSFSDADDDEETLREALGLLVDTSGRSDGTLQQSPSNLSQALVIARASRSALSGLGMSHRPSEPFPEGVGVGSSNNTSDTSRGKPDTNQGYMKQRALPGHGENFISPGHDGSFTSPGLSLDDNMYTGSRSVRSVSDPAQPEQSVEKTVKGRSPWLAVVNKENTRYELYRGLHMTVNNPVGYSCPRHLKLRRDDNGEYLCVGCGKGWVMYRQPREKEARCFPCGPGFYNELETATECLPCPIKYTTAPWDAASLDDCFKITISYEDTKRFALYSYLSPYVTVAVVTILMLICGRRSQGGSQVET